MGQRQSTDETSSSSKPASPPLTPFDPEKGTPEIFTRIVYINHIASFYGGEIFDAIFLASISRTFREAVQEFAPQLWYEIREQIKREPGFQNVVLSIARNHGDTLHWIVDRLFEKKSNLDVNFVLVNKRPLLIEALERKNALLFKKLLLEHDASYLTSDTRGSSAERKNALELTLTHPNFSITDREFYLKLLFSVGAKIDLTTNLHLIFNRTFSFPSDRSGFDAVTRMLEKSMALVIDDEAEAKKTPVSEGLTIKFADEEFLMNIIQSVTMPSNNGSDLFIFQTLYRFRKEMVKIFSSSSSSVFGEFLNPGSQLKAIATTTRIEDLFIKVIDKFFAANLHHPHKILEPSRDSKFWHSLTLAALIYDSADDGNSSLIISTRIYKVLLNHSRMVNKINFGKDYPFFYEVNQRGTAFTELPPSAAALTKNFVLDDRKKAYNAIELAILLRRFELIKLFCEEGRAKMTRSLTVMERSAEETETMFAFAERVYRHHDGRKPEGDEKQILEYLEDRIADNNENIIDDDDKEMVRKSEQARERARRVADLDDLMEKASALKQFSQPLK